MKEQDNKNKKYLLDGCDKDQLKSVFQGSLAFRFYSKKIQGREEGGLEIRFYKNLLPKHCKLELIENAFASLEKQPENIQLLKTLGEYTKNTPYEQTWCLGMGGGIGVAEYYLRSIPVMATAVICTIAAVTIFPSAFIIAAIAITSATLFAFNVASNGEPGLQFGRWIRDLVKGSSQEPANLSELEDNLNAGINVCKTPGERTVSSTVAPQESAAEQMSAQASSSVRNGFSYAAAVASNSTFHKPEPVEAKGSATNTPDDPSVRTGYTLSQG